jgi:hypothetical protein
MLEGTTLMWKIVGAEFPEHVRFASEREALLEALFWAGDDESEWNLTLDALRERLDYITSVIGEPITVEPA